MSSPYKWLRRPWRWPLELLLISVFMTESAAQRNDSGHSSCYYPTGVISPGKPCHPNAKNSVCCGPGFECLSNGLCQTSPLIDTPYKFSLYRSACTDPTFRDPACPHFCVGADDNPQAGQGMQICSAELATYCCKRDYDCCTNSTLVYALGKPEIVTIIPNHAAHPTTPPASAATHTPTPKDDSKQSTAYARDTIIGVGAGFAAAMAILTIGCCFWLSKRRPSERYRDRDRDRKSDVFEMDTLDDSRLAVHKELSASISQLDALSPSIDLDAPTRLELDTRRATIINQVVEMFELDASPSDDERRPDGTLVQGRSREGNPLEETLSPNRSITDSPRSEASPVPAPSHQRLYPRRSNPRISDIRMAATASRPVSEYTPVAGRVPTPLPDDPEPESLRGVPPVPPSPAAIVLPEILIGRKYSMERPRTSKLYDVSRTTETTPPQRSQAKAEASTRPGPSGPNLRRSILKTTTIDFSRSAETPSPEQFEAGPSREPGPGSPSLRILESQRHKLETENQEQSSSAVSTIPEVVMEITEPQFSASATGVKTSERQASQIPFPEQAPPERPAPEEPASKRPAPERSAPERPAPERPAPERPAPERPAPERPAPERLAPSKPAPERAASKPD